MEEKNRYSLKKVFLILGIILVINLVFNSFTFYSWANRLPFGMSREIFVSVFKPLNDFTTSLKLTVPGTSFVAAYRSVFGIKSDAGFGGGDYDVSKLDSLKKAADSLKKAQEEIVYSKEKPLKILLIGDSMMGPGFGYMMVTQLGADSAVYAKRFFKHSTGLSRPDYFDWFKQADALFAEDSYDVVIVMMGTNDAQGFEAEGQVHKFGSDSWIRIYGTRASDFMKLLTVKSKKVYWVGMPPMREPGFDGRMKTLSKIVETQASQYERVHFLSLLDVLGVNGTYQPFLNYRGKLQSMRENDGIHFTNAGGGLVADTVYSLIKTDFKFRAAAQAVQSKDADSLKAK
ncbi:MAG: DUF459 domain-containing protein [Ignavibacteriaceae bacterium]|nr:DUF459 domain-containing protein [Ignavibacteriaceae bacterium]